MASDIPYDPYHKWLGIPPEEQPPHFYRLLALQPFEDDVEVIHSAADQRMAHVRTFQSGIHSEASQKLLNELAAARICLLKPERKAAYDAELKSKLPPPQSGTLQAASQTSAAPPIPTTAPPSALSPPFAPQRAPLAPPPASLPPAYSLPQTTWAGQTFPTAIPIVRPNVPIAVPISAASTEAAVADEPDDLPFEAASQLRMRRLRATRKSDGLPLLLALIVILLFVVTVAMVFRQERPNQPRSTTTESPKAPARGAPPAAKVKQEPKLERKQSLKSKPEHELPPSNVAQSVVPLPPEPPSLPAHSKRMPSVIDNADSSGFTLSGEGWQTEAGDGRAFHGSIASRLPGDGVAAAEWKFNGLEPGKRYGIFVTWSKDPAIENPMWYGIRDGELGMQFLTVDQSIAPRPDLVFERHPFQKLATVRLSSHVLTVRLEGRADEHLRADAVLLSVMRE